MRFRFLTAVLFVASVVSAQTPPRRSIALTFDDLPMASGQQPTADEVTAVTKAILSTLHDHHATATGFVNEAKVHIGDDAARAAALELWLKDGHTLGNHTYSHPDFNKLSLAEFTNDAEKGEVLLNELLPKYHQKDRFFRFPFNHAGDTAEKKSGFEKWLMARHYQIATCTVENADWVFASAYERALQKNDSDGRKRIMTAYLDYTDAMLEFFEKASRDVFGREFPQVFLLHGNRLNADGLGGLLKIVEKRGYSIVPLAEAQSDAAYRTADNYVAEYGPVWIYRWAPVLGKKVDGRSEPEVPKWVEEMAK